jgi:NAD(P)-dependent dehydrogenase (short-subunit alcohol dehydrogenase family)
MCSLPRGPRRRDRRNGRSRSTNRTKATAVALSRYPATARALRAAWSGPVTETSYEDARNAFDSNLLSTFLVMKHFAPLMPPPEGRSSASAHGSAWSASRMRSCTPPPREG